MNGKRGGRGGKRGIGKDGKIDIQPESLRWLAPEDLVVHTTDGSGTVRVTLIGEQSLLWAIAVRAFPQGEPNGYVELFSLGPDGGGEERLGMIEDLADLPSDVRAAIESSLRENYLVPRIQAIREIRQLRHLFRWDVVTDRGPIVFEMERLHESVKIIGQKRAICRDTSENRYEIPDMGALDEASRAWLVRYL
jgi:hypothetical protein